jgi:hypothetical protein
MSGFLEEALARVPDKYRAEVLAELAAYYEKREDRLRLFGTGSNASKGTNNTNNTKSPPKEVYEV